MNGPRPSRVLLALTAALAGMAPSFRATEEGGIALPLGPPPPRLRDGLRMPPREVDAALRGDAPRPFRDERLHRDPTPEELAAQAKRERKAAKRARDDARREAGAPRRVEPVVEGHRFGFPTTITVEGRSS